MVVDLSATPEVHHDISGACSHPHRPYDCAIDLLPSDPLPSSQLSGLCRPEREAMERYLIEWLASGLIRPPSPVDEGFFFVKEEDGPLRPCIGYWGLSEITVKNRYPCLS